MIRLQKYLAKAGVASRRKAEILIQQGRVTVNGERAQLGMKVDENKDAICIDGKKVITDKKVYLLFNKPQGVVTTRFDPQGRPTVMDYLHDIPASIHPVGRLDYDSEGLLLLTNDGDLTLLLTHPRYQFPKTYQVLLQGKATGKIIQHLEQGVLLNGGKTAPAKARIIGYQNGNTLMELTIREGRNRQIRRMCAKLGFPVLRLYRTSLGFLTMGNLKPGKYRHLTAQEVKKLRQAAQSIAEKNTLK